MTRKPPAVKKVTTRPTTNEHERATSATTSDDDERAVPQPSSNLEERADDGVNPVNQQRAKPLKKSNPHKRALQDQTSNNGEPPSFEQTQKALRRYVENFYDIQEMRLAAGGRTAKKPRKDKNGNPVPEIKLHEWDKQRLESTKDALQAAEDIALKDIEACLDRVPFYVHVLSDKKAFRGIGPTMAGVILSSFDIHRSDTVSKMWALAGLRPMACYRCKSCQSVVSEAEGTFWHPKIDKIKCVTKPNETRELTRDQVYESANAQRAQAGVKLNFNKWLRTKLVGVLGPVILKMTTFHCPKCMDKMANLKDEDRKATEFYFHPARKENDERKPCEWSARKVEKEALVRVDAPFRKFYDDYKHRKTQAGWGVSDGHRHNASVRYMVKMILLDIHTKWRKFEGLPVRPTYQEQYLGHVHHEEQITHIGEVSQRSDDIHTASADRDGKDNRYIQVSQPREDNLSSTADQVDLDIEEAMLNEEIERASM